MKRIFSVLACVVLVFAMATVAMADGNVTVTADKDTVYLGDTVEVMVNVADAPNADTVGLQFTADSAFQFTSGEWLLSGSMVADGPKADGTGALVYMNATDLNGDIVKLVFEVVEDIAATKEISVTVQYVAGGSEVLTATDVKSIEVAKKPIEGITVAAKSGLVYTGAAKNGAEVVTITGTLPENATVTYDPANVEGAYSGNVKVTIEAPGFAKFEQNVAVNVAKAEAVISGVIAYDKAYDGTKDVTLEVTAATTVDGLLGNDGVTFDLVEGDIFTGLFADAEIGENKAVVAVKDITTVLTGAAAANYNLIIADGVKADITKTQIVATNIDWSDFYNVIITTATDSIEVNLNESAAYDFYVDNGDGTATVAFDAAFINEADADAYDSYIEITNVPVADVVEVDAVDATVFANNIFPAYYIKGMAVKFTAAKSGYRVARIEVTDSNSTYEWTNGVALDLTENVVLEAIFTKKTAVYPVAGSEEKTKSNKIVLTIGSVDATVFGTKKVNDVAPIIVNDRTMLPARFVAEALGAKVEWDDAAKKVSIFKDMKKIEIYIGKTNAYINGQAVALDAPALIQNSRTYMPVRFIAESLGAKVTWNDATRQVIITK